MLRQKLWFTVKAIEIRLRFIAVLVAIGLVIGYCDWIQNRWDKLTRPAADAAVALTGGEEFYRPMHPSVVRDSLDPGGAIPKCPICGMPLSKRRKGAPAPLGEGVLSRVQLSPYRVQLAGIETAEATHRPLVMDTRALGVVAVDERKLSRIVVRAAGYVEKLYVNESFTEVRQGQPLAEIYSPEIFTGTVSLIHPHVETSTRTLRVRCEVDNPNHELRPGMFATLRFKTPVVDTEPFRSELAAYHQWEQLADASVPPSPERDAELAALQKTCPVTNQKLGSMGTPIRAVASGRVVMLCCASCQDKLAARPDYYLVRLHPVTDEGVLAIPEQSAIDTGTQSVAYVERDPGVFEGVAVTRGASTAAKLCTQLNPRHLTPDAHHSPHSGKEDQNYRPEDQKYPLLTSGLLVFWST